MSDQNQQTQQTQQTQAPWHGYTEPADVQYVDNKGWKAPADAIKAYREAEKFIGRDPNTLLALPRADDPAGFRAVMAKLGLPESPDKYELDVPKEGPKPDEGYTKWAKDTFHKIGLPAPLAKQLTAEHNAYVKALVEQQTKDYGIKVEAEKRALMQEWGNGADRMMSAAKAAATTLGFTPEAIDALEHQMGYAGVYKFLAGLGQKLGEPGFKIADGGKPAGTGMLTPDEAKAEWNKMTLDANVMAALKDKSHPGHKAAQEKQNQLFAVMYPNG